MLRELGLIRYRCFERFALEVPESRNTLIIGKNGSGKSTLAQGLNLLSLAAREPQTATHLANSLVTPIDPNGTIFMVGADLGGQRVDYFLSLQPSSAAGRLEILFEQLFVDSLEFFHRAGREITYWKPGVGWNNIASAEVPVLALAPDSPEIEVFNQLRSWLKRVIVISPAPQQIGEFAEDGVQSLGVHGEHLASFYQSLIATKPRAYEIFINKLRAFIPGVVETDSVSFPGGRKLVRVIFGRDQKLTIPLKELSDGEKMYFLAATLIAAQDVDGPFTIFWDEPDHYLSLDAIQTFIQALRQTKGQFIATSHNAETINAFATDEILVLQRENYLSEPTMKRVSELDYGRDLVQALRLGEVYE